MNAGSGRNISPCGCNAAIAHPRADGGPKRPSRGHRLLFRNLLALLAMCFIAADGTESAASRVVEGLRHFFSGSYSEAEESFGQAAELQPENDIIQYDKACAAMANGNIDSARSLFQPLTIGSNTSLAIRSHYNLGCLESGVAKSKLGTDPAAAEGELREESVQLLLTAVRHYRDALRLEPEHQDARHNIELIRLFIKHIQSQWNERDKQKDRQEKDLLQFLMMLEQRQLKLQSETNTIQEQQDAPNRRQTLRQLAADQSELKEEIPPLKEKIQQAFAAAQQQQPAATASPATDQQTQQMLSATLAEVDQLAETMTTSSTAIASADFAAAADSQLVTLDGLNRLFMMAAPYQNLLQRALQTQQKLTSPETSTEGLDDADNSDPVVAADSAALQTDFERSAFEQRRVAEWAEVLALKAEAELPATEQQLAALPQPEPSSTASVDETAASADVANTTDATETAETTDSPQPAESKAQNDQDDGQSKQVEPNEDPVLPADELPADKLSEEERQQRQQIEQLEGLIESMERAMELAPQASTAADTAAEHLKAESQALASPDQAEALRLLQEIADPLKNDQQQDENEGQQDKNQQQNQDENQSSNDQQDNQSPQPQDDDQKSEPQSNQSEQQQQQQDEAESVIRQARERERDYREMLKAQQKLLGQKIPVDKDW